MSPITTVYQSIQSSGLLSFLHLSTRSNARRVPVTTSGTSRTKSSPDQVKGCKLVHTAVVWPLCKCKSRYDSSNLVDQ